MVWTGNYFFFIVCVKYVVTHRFRCVKLNFKVEAELYAYYAWISTLLTQTIRRRALLRLYKKILFAIRAKSLRSRDRLPVMPAALTLVRMECENSYFRYKCEKVILSSWARLRPGESRVKRPLEDKITCNRAFRCRIGKFHEFSRVYSRSQRVTLFLKSTREYVWYFLNNVRFGRNRTYFSAWENLDPVLSYTL